MKARIISAIFALFLFSTMALANNPNKTTGTRNRVPVKEITVFKDGHVFVLQEGALPTDASGNVAVDYLPSPVLGTFWPYSADKNIKLLGASAGRQKISYMRTALDIRSLLEANIGAEIIVTERVDDKNPPLKYSAAIVGIPMTTKEEESIGLEIDDNDIIPQTKSNLIMLKTENGIKVLAMERIQDVTFKQAPKTTLPHEELRNRLLLKLDWGTRKATPTADVGLLYVQKGIRWIPGYQVRIDGNGNAVIKLQATLLNELTDLNNVAVNLVVGVPSFAFKDTLDPIALGQSVEQLSQYFQTNSNILATNGVRNRNNSFTVDGIDNNDITRTQATRMGERVIQQPINPQTPGDLGPELNLGQNNDDLYIFKVNNITLKKGSRMVVTIAEQTVKYQDVYALDIPALPPSDYSDRLSSSQQQELARLKIMPKFQHKLRITNSTINPFTTAPVLLTKDDQVIAESLMTFTPVGGTTEIDLTKSVDIAINKTESEIKRIPLALKVKSEVYSRVDLEGKIDVTNYRSQPVYLEITRNVLGNIGTASDKGVVEKTNVLENGTVSYGYFSVPSWWSNVNGVGRITWKFTLDPGKSEELKYNWHYFWQ